MLALLGEVVMCATYEGNKTGRDDREQLRAFLFDMLDELLDMALEIDE